MPIVDGAKLHAIRERRMLSQMDLAKASGVSDRTIRDLELGKYSQVRFVTVRKLAKALKVDASELLAEEPA